MAMKTINYNVNLDGITPSVEQFAGTQGDHRVTKLNFTLSDELYNSIVDTTDTGNAVYRFDVYDGEGGIWQSEEKSCEKTVGIELEERHTRFGGKITVYLVITVLDSDNKTKVELYSFPVKLKLQNRPEGIYKDGENIESVSSLCEIAKVAANETEEMKSQVETLVVDAENSVKTVKEFSQEIEQKLKNGEYDGVGVQNTEVVNGQLMVTYTDGTIQNAGDVIGPKGDTGPIGPKGNDGKDAVVEQHFSNTSENAQSGVAVAEALANLKEDKVVSGWGGIIINEGDKTVFDARLTSDAPEHTPVKIYNKNYVGEHNYIGLTLPQTDKEDIADVITSITLVNWGSGGAYFNDYAVAKLGEEFTFNGGIQSPSEFAHYVGSELVCEIPGYNQIRIPLKDLEVGSKYSLNIFVDTNNLTIDFENGPEIYEHTITDIFVFNETKAVIEEVKEDGTINADSIQPYSLVCLGDITIPNEYSLNLTYSTTDFALKKYVDEKKLAEQTYNAKSEIAQSGKAVAEALQSYVAKVEGNGHTFQAYCVDSAGQTSTFEVEDCNYFEYGISYGRIPYRQNNGNLLTNTPVKELDCVNKKYVDDIVGDIESLLGGI